MFVRLQDGLPTEWPVQDFQIRSAYRDRSFPMPLPPESVAALGFEPFEIIEAPNYDERVQRLRELAPVKGSDGVWRQTWQIDEIYPDANEKSRVLAELESQEIAGRIEHIKTLRRMSYLKYADPLYFKAQRGEATLEEWQAKIAEIKAEFPY
jgi:hypothetical protein